MQDDGGIVLETEYEEKTRILSLLEAMRRADAGNFPSLGQQLLEMVSPWLQNNDWRDIAADLSLAYQSVSASQPPPPHATPS
jgi:hypothetical protein